MSNILLISFKFPPFPGVGAFRWCKMAKYLAKSGHEIHVLTVPWKMDGKNSLTHDAQLPNIYIHKISSGYCHNLRYSNLGHIAFNWLKIKTLLFLDQLCYWDDEAQQWGKYLLPAAKDLIQRYDIKVVIATGAPFEANYWAAKLKQQCPDIYLIQDFRDPWVQNPFKKYWFGRKKLAYQRMQFALNTANTSITVTPGLVVEYKKVCPDGHVHLVTNGYDPEMTRNIVITPEQIEPYSFIHIGNISNGRDVACCKFLDIVRSLRHIPVKVTLIGHVPLSVSARYKDLMKQNTLMLMDTVSPEKALEYVAHNQVGLHFGSKAFPYALSTKLFEYAGLKKPVLSINYGEDVHDIIQQYQLGISADLRKDNDATLSEKLLKVLDFNVSNSNIACFSYKQLAYQVELIICEGLKITNHEFNKDM